MTARWLILALLLVGSREARGQTIHGRVYEDSTRVPIVGARLQLLAGDGTVVANATSDSSGAFLLQYGRGGRLTVLATHPFFAPVRSGVLRLRDGELVSLELRMGLSAVPLEPVMVSARREARLAGYYERLRRPDGFGQFLTREQIEARPGARVTDLLRGLRGVEVFTSDRRERVQLIAMGRVQGRCEPSMYVDGMPVRQFAQGGIDSFLRPDMLEGVEVYTTGGRAPPGLHNEGACGVIAFWTRAPDEGSKWNWLKLLGSVAGFVVLVKVLR